MTAARQPRLGERSLFSPHLRNIHFFCLSYLEPSVSVAWSLLWAGTMLKSDHQGRFEENAAPREGWGRVGGLLRTGESQGWGCPTLTCRSKNLSFPTGVWPPQSDRTILDQKDSHSVVKQCSPNAPQPTDHLGSCSTAHSDPGGQGLGLCMPRKLPEDTAALRTTAQG